ncbi:hypothetical protein BACDOR_00586 [Phocaeicola dorei DSM 17855]|uniref:Uncharacterized protein n=1 Tax=Phocaeicola dorei DSM 17855 TaxID=483217 RepID=B6VT16_9BACT|nr:hypothetical protein BACDOR_00586 [Phocaeicola dorei DSM 17855]
MPPAEHIHHGHEEQQGDEAAQVGEQHAIDGQQVAVVRIGADDSQQGGVGHIDGRIDHHHQRVSGIGIDDFGGQAPLRSGERKDADERERHGKKQQVGTELAPARMGAVCQDADYGVEGGIPYPGDQEHGAYRGGRHTEHVGIKYHEIGTEELPEHGRGHVSQSVTYLFFEHYHGNSIFMDDYRSR